MLDTCQGRDQLAAQIADAIAAADALGEIVVGCHLSAAQAALQRDVGPWSAEAIEAALNAVERERG